jgi:hypothetical protein
MEEGGKNMKKTVKNEEGCCVRGCGYEKALAEVLKVRAEHQECEGDSWQEMADWLLLAKLSENVSEVERGVLENQGCLDGDDEDVKKALIGTVNYALFMLENFMYGESKLRELIEEHQAEVDKAAKKQVKKAVKKSAKRVQKQKKQKQVKKAPVAAKVKRVKQVGEVQKRGRGRPKKAESQEIETKPMLILEKKKRGRPAKLPSNSSSKGMEKLAKLVQKEEAEFEANGHQQKVEDFEEK